MGLHLYKKQAPKILLTTKPKFPADQTFLTRRVILSPFFYSSRRHQYVLYIVIKISFVIKTLVSIKPNLARPSDSTPVAHMAVRRFSLIRKTINILPPSKLKGNGDFSPDQTLLLLLLVLFVTALGAIDFHFPFCIDP